MPSADVSDAEIKAMTAVIEAVSLKDKIHVKPILQAVLKAMEKPDDDSPLLAKWLAQTQKAEKIFHLINPKETTVTEITEIFNLDKEQMWELVENDLIEVPLILKRNLHNLKRALYNTDSEATCRIAVDFMLIQCRIHLLDKHSSAETSHDTETNITNATNATRTYDS